MNVPEDLHSVHRDRFSTSKTVVVCVLQSCSALETKASIQPPASVNALWQDRRALQRKFSTQSPVSVSARTDQHSALVGKSSIMLNAHAGVPRFIRAQGIKSSMPILVGVGVDSHRKVVQVHKCLTGFRVNVSVLVEQGSVQGDRYLIRLSVNVAAHVPSAALETNASIHRRVPVLVQTQ